jgi:hypothetical protein
MGSNAMVRPLSPESAGGRIGSKLLPMLRNTSEMVVGSSIMAGCSSDLDLLTSDVVTELADINAIDAVNRR